jgi:ATP-dependent RNA helicase DeaD
MLQGDAPLQLSQRPDSKREGVAGQKPEKTRERPARESARAASPEDISPEAPPLRDHPEVEMERFRVEVGHRHGVKPGNIVGAIANEAELESRYIGRIQIFDDFSVVDLPAGMPAETFRELKKARVCGERLEISRLGDKDNETSSKPGKKSSKRKPKGKRQ